MNRILFKRFLVFLTVILTVAVMTFALTACSFATTDGGKDNTSDVTDDDKDNTGEVTDDGNGDVDAGGNEGGNDEGGADGDETTPDEPENPIDPDDPEKPIDPEDPEQPVDPDDPENPVDPENPDKNEPQDITEVDEIDEINKFADEVTHILNDSYLNDVIKKFAGKSATADKIVDGTLVWRIVGKSDNITGLEVSFKYQDNNNINFYAGSVKLPNCSVKELLAGDVEATSYSRDFSNGITTSMEQANKELGNLVINVVNGTDTTTQNEGDIWCSIQGGSTAIGGKDYRVISVYQITENQVQKYEITVEAPTINVEKIMQNIKDGKTKGTPTCETMYTFTGIVIE